MVTGVAAGVSGPAFIIGLLIAGIIAAFNALSSAQLAVVYPFSGGTYEYGYQLLKPAFGFSAGWMFLISKLSAAGVVAIGFGSYFYQLVPVASPLVISLIAIVFLTLANYYGIKKAGKLNMIIEVITLLSLTYLIYSGIRDKQGDVGHGKKKGPSPFIHGHSYPVSDTPFRHYDHGCNYLTTYFSGVFRIYFAVCGLYYFVILQHYPFSRIKTTRKRTNLWQSNSGYRLFGHVLFLAPQYYLSGFGLLSLGLMLHFVNEGQLKY